ncbi:peptidase M14 [Flavobacterium rivuli WB 3.3-2 = DSM 21788]|uniref:Peptidase M14 n=1 Tax=Flavobacterium rivuli WB 3.3-2 = DSM 21788 TaxID=1121895 RepID=A0A0A2LXX1_9FLAO|nr:M14 metallopeptidase family protein [Flavobacterium rivuli]KGO85217.1 peptidase M14 [Flavobacterium rivuli WB 3.3-2 = DSM 21788]
MNLEIIYNTHKAAQLGGRYITNAHIEPLLTKLKLNFKVGTLGTSAQNRSIYAIEAGTGNVRIFIWSQMHGNESTTTKAVFDFLNYLQSEDAFAKELLSYFTFYILPIVNPDGAVLYTRANANTVDLNRDSVSLTQPESRILRKAFEDFKPDYCYNMHDQRTIFGVGDTPKPATVSFLAPSYNEAREINNVRQKAIDIIVAMNNTLQAYIPGQVGRFDDSFNINCIGDMFQSLNVPTILFEAGHYEKDYEREKTRKFIFFALFSGFKSIYENVVGNAKNDDYFNIPQNKIIFYDIIYKKVKINYENKEKFTNFASQYKEELIDNSVIFQAIISEIGNLEGKFGHAEIDCNGAEFTGLDGSKFPKLDEKADFLLDNSRKFVNGQEVEAAYFL